MRISAWSSDVCSSDLRAWRAFRCRRSRLEAVALEVREHVLPRSMVARGTGDRRDPAPVLRDDAVVAARRLADLVALLLQRLEQLHRESVVAGKGVTERVDIGVRGV